MVHHFQYKDGRLRAEDVDLIDLASQVGTPFYIYSTATFTRHIEVIQNAFKSHDTLVCYAMKANSNQAILKLVANMGVGADVVSLGELKRALKAGIPGSKIVFSGVAKSREEMKLGLEADIKCFNAESEPELERLNDVAGSVGKIAPVSVRINPDVDAKTHAKISTGKAENKFGIPFQRAVELYRRISAMQHLDPVGIDMHIGSQITHLDPFNNAFKLLAGLVGALREQGHDIRHVDVGGGLGIPYNQSDNTPPDPEAYAQVVLNNIRDLDCQLVLEPGRMVAGNAGILVTKVEYIKEGAERTFVIVDAGMNDMIRPTLYEAHHDAMPLLQSHARRDRRGDIVGPVCETGDYLARNRRLPEFNEGDYVAIMSAGAYGAVMSGTYNTRPLCPEVLVDRDRYHVIRKRQSLDDLIALDSIPDWITQA